MRRGRGTRTPATSETCVCSRRAGCAGGDRRGRGAGKGRGRERTAEGMILPFPRLARHGGGGGGATEARRVGQQEI